VYEARPLQCRTYPFWSSSLGSREDWDTLGRSCPGVNKGKLYTEAEIEERLLMRRKEILLGVNLYTPKK
jgi:Fe-S-cluster containining protein